MLYAIVGGALSVCILTSMYNSLVFTALTASTNL